MPEIKKSSKPDLPLVLLKWLVTILSVVMVLGFLFLITILGIKISNFNTTPQNHSESPNREILIPNGIIETIDIENETLTVVVKSEYWPFGDSDYGLEGWNIIKSILC